MYEEDRQRDKERTALVHGDALAPLRVADENGDGGDLCLHI